MAGGFPLQFRRGRGRIMAYAAVKYLHPCFCGSLRVNQRPSTGQDQQLSAQWPVVVERCRAIELEDHGIGIVVHEVRAEKRLLREDGSTEVTHLEELAKQGLAIGE